MNAKETIRLLSMSAILSSYLFAGGSVVGQCPQVASKYLVTNSSDSGADSTLRACVYRAGQSSLDSIVAFNSDMSIYLSNPIVINGAHHLSIDGEGQNIVIDGEASNQVLVDNNTNKITLKDLTLQNGLDSDNTDGGGAALFINDKGDTEINGVTFLGNKADTNINGGAIFVKGRSSKDLLRSLTISNSHFNNNSSKFGAALYVEDNVSAGIYNSTFQDNNTTYGAVIYAKKDTDIAIRSSEFKGCKTDTDNYASAIYTDSNSTLNIDNTLFKHNDSHVLSGSDGVSLVTSEGKYISISSSTFEENNATVLNVTTPDGNVTIENSAFKLNNTLDKYFPMFNIYASSLDMNNSHFKDNTFAGFALAVMAKNTKLSNSDFMNNITGYSILYLVTGSQVLQNITLANNQSVNGELVIGYSANFMLNNSTITDNIDSNGTIWTSDSNITIDSSTIYNNISTIGEYAGIVNISGVDRPFSKIDLANTILINNTVSGVEKNSNHDFGDVIYSIIGSDVTASTLFANQIGVNPKLKPLSDNGGSTMTRALMANSPAIDAGSTLLGADQRGEDRDNHPDIGAYEYKGGALAPIYYLLMF